MQDPATDRLRVERAHLVKELAAAGICSRAVLDAVATFARHELIPDTLREHAYENRPLPIGSGQTISQPFIVAFMSEALEVVPGMSVLEIGTGSGYQAGILATLGARVYSVEIVPGLAASAAAGLARLGVRGVEIRVGDGYHGWPEHAPYGGVIVTAAPRFVPPPLVTQLAEGGRIAIPLGGEGEQVLEVSEKRAGELVARRTLPVRFVPMVGVAERIDTLH